MATWKIPGHPTPPTSHPAALQSGRFRDQVAVDSVDLIEVAANRSGAPPAVLANVADDDLLEIELHGGVRQWMLAEQFRLDFVAEPAAQRGVGTEAGVVEVDPQLRIGGPTRGARKWALKRIRRLKVRIAGELLGELDTPTLAASALCAALERRFMPDPGFKRWGGGASLQSVEAGEIDAGRPALVFLHGTFSNTAGSFSDLSADAALWDGLTHHYGDQIFSLDHHTIGASPIENAIDLVRGLPRNARLHLVSHSRGGLVGELLCRAERVGGAPFDELDYRVILGDPSDDPAGADRRRQQEQLHELDALLRDRKPRIERFVRIAAPAAGTSLASERLDRWLSILLNAAKLVPVLALSPTYEFVSSFTAAVLRKRLDPGVFPGIEAMRPQSPLIRLLNRPDVVTTADLTVIAGDLEGHGIWGSVKHWVTDLIYAGDHDVVVNTPSMYGGAKRARSVYFFDHGAKVNHFHYFSNPRTAKKLQQGLDGAGPAEALFERRREQGFLSLEDKRELLRQKEIRLGKALVRGSREAQDKPVAFVLPGIMGTALSQDEDEIWVNPIRLALGQMARLGIDNRVVRPTRLLAGPYGDLIEHLSVDHAVQAFPYDWRLSLAVEAKRLAREVRRALDETRRPVRLLAHSLGGLLARAMFAQDQELWNRFRQRAGSRLVMLGTPNDGSFKIARVLLGRDKLLRILSLVDLANSKREMVEIVARFPGILELLPGDEGRYFDPAVWHELAKAAGDDWPTPAERDLSRAREVRQMISKLEPDPARMSYVAGVADETPVGVEVDEQGRLRFLASQAGDGSVLWRGGVVPELDAWYMDAPHGKLADHQPSFEAIAELLSTGETARLSKAPPARARDSADEPFELTEETIESYPDALDLQAAAVGYSFQHVEQKRVEPLQVSVRHGDVAFADSPVIAGHHDGDAIWGAEKALDRLLDGRLTDRLALGLYAGKIGSSEIILEDRRPDGDLRGRRGAVIVGLGPIGKLLPSGLESSVAQGALRYALEIVEEEKALGKGRPPANPATAPLVSLVVGRGFGGLSAAESLGAIVKGVLRAQDALVEKGLSDWVRLPRLEFIELYRDRAIQAAELLLRLRDDPALNKRVTAADELLDGRCGRSRVPPNEAADWWHRVQIASRNGDCADGASALSFTTMTGRARADVDVLPLQLDNVQRFVEKAVSRPAWNAEVANTLFHLLLPNELKPMALEERNLVLLLGPEAAAYPWELLHDQTSHGADPLVTRGGLIRQLAGGERGRPPVEPVAGAALVIGNPPTHLPDLPGAEEESRAVAAQLEREGLQVTSKIGVGADEVQMALFAKPYQILHLAGHGEIDAGLRSGSVDRPQGSTGMVIGDRLYLTPSIVAQLPQTPELVFINCCHLGAISPDRDHRFHLLAANLGAQFIQDGVRAVVAAGWAVDDAAAKTFAGELYRRMLAGAAFGDAVRHARKLTYRRHPRVNTFGAYQCYGDPTYRLRLPAHPDNGSRSRKRYVSPDHAAFEFDAIRHAAEAAPGDERDGLRRRLTRLASRMPQRWLESSSVLNASMGEALDAVGLLDDALAAYDRALRQGPADAPVRILRRRGLAHIAKGCNESDPTARETQILRGVADLKRLLELGETAERHLLLGSAYGRLYLEREPRIAADLEQMASHCRQAYERKLDSGDWDVAQPLVDWLSAVWGIEQTDPQSGKCPEFDWNRALNEAAERALGRDDRPSFEAAWMALDCRLFAGLIETPYTVHGMAGRYRELFECSPEGRERALESLRFRAALLHGGRAKALHTLLSALDASPDSAH